VWFCGGEMADLPPLAVSPKVRLFHDGKKSERRKKTVSTYYRFGLAFYG
jgi:hypothetical protein